MAFGIINPDLGQIWDKLDEMETTLEAILVAIGGATQSDGIFVITPASLPLDATSPIIMELPILAFNYKCRIESIQFGVQTGATAGVGRFPVIKYGEPLAPSNITAFTLQSDEIGDTEDIICNLSRNSDPESFSFGSQDFICGRCPDSEIFVDVAIDPPAVQIYLEGADANDAWQDKAGYPIQIVVSYQEVI